MNIMSMTQEEKKRFIDLESKVNGLEKKIDKILAIVKGIAIGLIIGGILFGVFSLKDLLSVVK